MKQTTQRPQPIRNHEKRPGKGEKIIKFPAPNPSHAKSIRTTHSQFSQSSPSAITYLFPHANAKVPVQECIVCASPVSIPGGGRVAYFRMQRRWLIQMTSCSNAQRGKEKPVVPSFIAQITTLNSIHQLIPIAHLVPVQPVLLACCSLWLFPFAP